MFALREDRKWKWTLPRIRKPFFRALEDRAIQAVIVGSVSRRAVEALAARNFVTYETTTIRPSPRSYSRDNITVKITLAGRKRILAAKRRLSGGRPG
jgi:hypothetical protein